MSTDSTDTVTWYITFGLGGPFAGRYSEIVMPASWSRDAQHEMARATAFDSYGTAWAFEYPPERFEQAIRKYGMTLRETILVTAIRPDLLDEVGR